MNVKRNYVSNRYVDYHLIRDFLYFNFCSSCQIDESNSQENVISTAVPIIEEAPESKPTFFPFSIKNDDFDYSVNDNFNFLTDSLNFVKPLSAKIDNGIIRLKNYLETNPNQTIHIYGFYKSNEKNASGFENLGQARANSVKNYFISKGIPSVQTDISGKLNDDLIPSSNLYLGPVSYEISEIEAGTKERLKAFYQELKDNPLILYFETGQSSINLSAEQRLKFTQITEYLDKINGSSCTVDGHSDNTGNKNQNYVLAQNRADFIKIFLIKNGIPDSKINTASYGQDRPIAPNDTEESRAKNRRIEITLK